jgi:TetR/AcrR family transcriptional regulator, transcriptional repressor for nem operon
MGRTSDARDRLIESAQELMHERGFTAVGVSEVCDRAEVNKGSFYHFFPSKQELALAVIDRYGEATVRQLREMVEGEGPPLQRLQSFYDRNYTYHKELRDERGQCLGCPLGNLALEMSPQDPVLRKRLSQIFDSVATCYEKLLDEAVERGDIPRIDTRQAAYSLLALQEGRVMLAKLNDDPELLRSLGEEAFRLLRVGDASTR